MLTNIKKLDLNLNGIKLLFYINTDTNEIVEQVDPRLSCLSDCIDNTIKIGCVKLCDTVVEDQVEDTVEPNLELVVDIEGVTINFSGCSPHIVYIDIIVNEDYLFQLSGDYSEITFQEIVDYINAQPTYQTTNEEITLLISVEDCEGRIISGNLVSFN